MNSIHHMKSVVRWIENRLPVLGFFHGSIASYLTPKNLNFWWNFGWISGVMLIIQIVTGTIIASY